MPSATARRLYEDQIPSFMSVYDLGSETMGDRESVTVVDPKTIGFPGSNFDSKPYASHAHTLANQSSTAAADHTHRHHDSTSTQDSESADSSPTTTMSCTDSASLSDPSPSSSPDSPVNLVPLAAFPGPSFGVFPSMSAGLASLSVDGNASSNMNSLCYNSSANTVGMGIGASSNTPLQRPMTSPSPRRARNMKGLSIQPPFVSPPASSQGSEPTSPSFIKPQIPTMKRKPSQLSLKTSTRELSTTTIVEGPQSPTISIAPIMQRRALKHSTSSPHILSSLKSATFGPPGGMSFGTVLERNESGLSEFLRPSKPTAGPVGYDSTILEENSPIRTQIASRAAFEFEPFHENENNEDQKTPGYPDGPIAIYSDNIYLYLEPTAEEASHFDVVINVAREVKNPFKAGPTTKAQPKALEPQTKVQSPQPRRESAAAVPALEPVMEHEPEMAEEHENHGTVPMVIEPTQHEPAKSKLKLKAPPVLSFTRTEANESGSSSDKLGTPTTPKATFPAKEPEYIHMPWDHNTDISQDLIMLCEMIERKTSDGKKVLIHCQQGASRSASLIIAYGIWQNPELSVNDAYYAAQSKSRWISPNMRLMYCLQDFQKEMGKRRQPATSALRPRSGRSPTKHRIALSVDAIDLAPKEPLSAPLPAEDSAGNSNMLSPERSPMRPRGNSTPQSRDGISPGPSSAPSAFSWGMQEDAQDPQRFGRFEIGFSSTVEPPESPRATEAPQMCFPTMKLGQPPKLEPLPSGLRPSALAWPGSESAAFGKPPPSPSMFPSSQAWPGSESMSFGKPPPSPAMFPSSQAWPGSESMSFGKPPPSPAMFPSSQAWPSSESQAFGKTIKTAPSLGPAPSLGLRPNLQPVESNSKPPPSPGLRPMTLSLPGRGSDASSKPPPSPGFAAHRFGKFSTDTTHSSTASSSSNTTSNNTVSSVSPSYSPGFPRPRSSCSGGLDSILAHNMSGSGVGFGSGSNSGFPPLQPMSFSSIDRGAVPSNKLEAHEAHAVSICPAFQVEEPLMSPRAETMTKNPLHNDLADTGMRFVEVPPTPSDGLFSPRESMFPRDPFYPFGRPTQVADPRSPPTLGETPIVRSIDELM